MVYLLFGKQKIACSSVVFKATRFHAQVLCSVRQF